MRNEATRYFQPALSIGCALSYQENPRSESVGDPPVLSISFVGRSKAGGYLAAMVLIASRCYFSASVAGLLFLVAILFCVSFSVATLFVMMLVSPLLRIIAFSRL